MTARPIISDPARVAILRGLALKIGAKDGQDSPEFDALAWALGLIEAFDDHLAKLEASVVAAVGPR